METGSPAYSIDCQGIGPMYPPYEPPTIFGNEM